MVLYKKNNWTHRKNNSGSNPHQFSACIHALQWWIGISATGAHLRTEDDNARQRLRPSLVQRQAEGGGMWRCQLCSTASQCRLRCCKNTAHSVSWPEVVKVVSNQGVDCFVSYGSFSVSLTVFLVYVVLCLIVFGCQYQCSWLPGKTRLRNDLLCVEWDVKPYTLTQTDIHVCR